LVIADSIDGCFVHASDCVVFSRLGREKTTWIIGYLEIMNVFTTLAYHILNKNANWLLYKITKASAMSSYDINAHPMPFWAHGFWQRLCAGFSGQMPQQGCKQQIFLLQLCRYRRYFIYRHHNGLSGFMAGKGETRFIWPRSPQWI
jgi:hypothetical protein